MEERPGDDYGQKMMTSLVQNFTTASHKPRKYKQRCLKRNVYKQYSNQLLNNATLKTITEIWSWSERKPRW